MHEPAGKDWLDACWRCGAAEAHADDLGRLLCQPCRTQLSDASSDAAEDGFRVARDAYWEAHVMERCWRCLNGWVEPEDDVGLCRSCLDALTGTDAGDQTEPGR